MWLLVENDKPYDLIRLTICFGRDWLAETLYIHSSLLGVPAIRIELNAVSQIMKTKRSTHTYIGILVLFAVIRISTELIWAEDLFLDKV